MKLNLITLLISFIGLHGVQQTNDVPREDGVENSRIHIVDHANNSFNMGSRLQLEKAFGKTKMVKEDAEILEGGYVYTYNYKGLSVSYSKKHCESTEIKGPEYKITLNGIAYSVGEPITKLKTAFPVSYKNRHDNFLRLGIKYKGKWMDAYIAFSYNSKGIITSIEVANDNS